MLEESHDNHQIIQRVAALDIGKAELVCWGRVPHPTGPATAAGGGSYPTMTTSLVVLVDRLGELG